MTTSLRYEYINGLNVLIAHSQAIYCDEDCRSKAAVGHSFEHKMLSYHHCHESARKDLISTRIVTKAGPQLLFNLFQRRKMLNQKDERKDKNGSSEVSVNDVYFNPGKDTVLGHNENGVYESESYLPIYHLISHANSTPLIDTVSNVFRAIVLTHLLRDTSNFFDLLQDQYSVEFPQEQFEEFVGSLLLKHIENVPCNAVSISELQNEQQDLDMAHLSANSLKNCKSITYAVGIFCLMSLANHSCDPNAVIARKSELQQTALVSVRSLAAGDEIFITYKPQFTSQITQDRRSYLLDRYHFLCQCRACVSNWSLESHVDYRLPTIKCAQCIMSKMKSSATCRACEKASINLAFQLDNYQTKLYEADDLLQSGDFIQAIQVLQNALQFFSTHFSSVFSLYQVAQDLYKRALLFLLYSYD